MTTEKPGFMSADAYGRSLAGFGINLLVRDIARSLAFARDVLEAEIVYAERDFAVLRRKTGSGSRIEWMLHGDATYSRHPLLGLIEDSAARGGGVELRLYDCDPDLAVARAEAGGYTILAPALDKPHGLREAYILDPDGYCWVPSRPK